MSEKHNAEVWVAIDHDGDYAVGISRESAIDAYESDFASAIAGIRVVCIDIAITLPEDVSVSVDIPDEAGTIVEASTEETTEATP